MEPATQTGADVSGKDRLRAAISNQLGLAAQPEPAPEEPETAPEAEEVEATPSAEATPDVTEDVTPETPDDHQDVSEGEDESFDLSDISSLFGTDPDKFVISDDGQISVKTKIDGKEGQAKLSELIKSYQLEGHLNKQNMEVQEQRKALEAERQKVQQEAQQKFQILEDSTRLALNHLTGEFNSIDWAQLETSDPARYALLRQKFADRHQQIQQNLYQLQAERQRQQEGQLAELSKRKAEELNALATKIPEWATEEGFSRGQKEVKEGLSSHYGYSDDEVSAVLYQGAPLNTVDHRLYMIVRDALAYRKLQSSKPDVMKKVAKAPKVVKGGSRPDVKKTSKAQETLERIRKTGGKKGDLVAYLKAKQS